ncbi:MAG: shikimate kinase [Bacteroidota bacterium]
MRIYLLGYMTSGKSWLGKELALATGLEFSDLDEQFEERYRVSILDFFEKYGEPLFRQLEQELLHETIALDEVIISPGGGVPSYADNMAFILKSGTSIYLRMEVPELVSRIIGIKKKRPLLKDLDSTSLETFVRDQLAERETFYLQANYIFDGPDYPVEEIIRVLGIGH